MYNVEWDLTEAPPAIDIYDQNLQYDLGVSGDGYEKRDVYTNDLYYNDLIQIKKNIQNKNFDFVADKAKNILAKYKFEDEKLSTMTALAKADIFDEKSETSSLDKIIMISSLKDPELYMWFFMILNPSEQNMLIEYKNVQCLPGYNYTDISVEMKSSGSDPIAVSRIGYQSFYIVTMVYKTQTIKVYMLSQPNFKIFYINNVQGTLDGNTYVGEQ